MIYTYKVARGTWGNPITSNGIMDGYERKVDTYSWMVWRSVWHRLFGRHRHVMDLEIDELRDGKPYIGDDNVLEWLDTTVTGAVYVAAFEHYYQKHPQAPAFKVTNMAARFTKPGDLVLFKLRFSNLTKKDSLQDYVVT